jgi:WD40 repeat protein
MQECPARACDFSASFPPALATLTRDAEGYFLEAVRTVQVNGRPVERVILRGTLQQGQLVWRLAFSGDNRLLAVSTIGGMSVWEVQDRQPRQSIQWGQNGEEGNAFAVAFSPDSRALATGTDRGKLVLRDAATGTVYKEWQLPGPLHWVSYAPDGRHLLTVNGNHTGYVLRLAGPP